LENIRGNLNWRLRGMSFFVALMFSFSIFSMMPVSAHHSDTDNHAHIVTAVDDNTTSDSENSPDFHIEQCGVASCAMSLPECFTYASIDFGAKVPFEVSGTQLTSLHLLPADRPPIT
jgi:hypothetical protein